MATFTLDADGAATAQVLATVTAGTTNARYLLSNTTGSAITFNLSSPSTELLFAVVEDFNVLSAAGEEGVAKAQTARVVVNAGDEVQIIATNTGAASPANDHTLDASWNTAHGTSATNEERFYISLI